MLFSDFLGKRKDIFFRLYSNLTKETISFPKIILQTSDYLLSSKMPKDAMEVNSNNSVVPSVDEDLDEDGCCRCCHCGSGQEVQ